MQIIASCRAILFIITLKHFAQLRGEQAGTVVIEGMFWGKKEMTLSSAPAYLGTWLLLSQKDFWAWGMTCLSQPVLAPLDTVWTSIPKDLHSKVFVSAGRITGRWWTLEKCSYIFVDTPLREIPCYLLRLPCVTRRAVCPQNPVSALCKSALKDIVPF